MTDPWLTNPPCAARQMRNAATLLNLVELSVAVASIPAGLIVKGTQAAGKCAAVLPGKASSVIKTNRSPTHKPVAKAKAPALPKALEKCWQPWQVSVTVVLLSALVAIAWVAFVSEDATSSASARGAQPVLHTNTTGNCDVVHTNTTGNLDVTSCPSGICLDPPSDMADDLALAAVKKTTLLVGSPFEESASLSEQVWPLCSYLHFSMHLHHMPHLLLFCAPRHAASTPSSACCTQSPHFRNATLRPSEMGPKHVAVLEGEDEQRHWTQLSIAAMGAFLFGPSAISTALGPAILQPLCK